MKAELAFLDATAQAELVRRREASPAELVEAAIERIEKTNPEINAVIQPLFDEARAAASSPAAAGGAFGGVPFLLKDLGAHALGQPLHAGTKFLREARFVEDHDSFVVEKYRRAGLVFVGRTNTPELGLTVTTEPATYGATRNPWNPSRSAGGSSGGAAAAVAAGLVPAAHASDGGGSIRIPASECGLVGLKPSRGRVSLGPDLGESWAGFVTTHALTRSVRDSAALLDVVAGAMPGDPVVAPPPARPYAQEVGAPSGRLRCGLLTALPGRDVHGDCVAAVHGAAKLLADLGHSVEEAHPRALEEPEFSDHFLTVVASWVVHDLGYWGKRVGRRVERDDVEPATWALAEMGRAFDAARYVESVNWLASFTRRMAAWWDRGFDLLVTPTIGQPPPRIGELVPSAGDPLGTMDKVMALIPFTPPFNVTGQPAVSLPLHWNEAGLPIGVQLVAAYGGEDVLFRVAAALENAKPWSGRRPRIHA